MSRLNGHKARFQVDRRRKLRLRQRVRELLARKSSEKGEQDTPASARSGGGR